MKNVAKIIALGGGTAAVARACGTSMKTVSAWKRRGQIPAHRVAAVAAATGVPAEQIRPDVFRIHRARSGGIRPRAQAAMDPR